MTKNKYEKFQPLTPYKGFNICRVKKDDGYLYIAYLDGCVLEDNSLQMLKRTINWCGLGTGKSVFRTGANGL
jgi:hypothetical protein